MNNGAAACPRSSVSSVVVHVDGVGHMRPRDAVRRAQRHLEIPVQFGRRLDDVAHDAEFLGLRREPDLRGCERRRPLRDLALA